MNIILDIDDTIAHSLSEWLRIYNFKYNDNLTTQDITDWDITKFVKCGNDIFNILEKPDFYKNILPIDGSVQFVNYLKSLGHRVIFVTTPYGKSAGKKLEWLCKHGFLPSKSKFHKDYVECNDKSLILADYIIDDKTSTIEYYLGQHLEAKGCLFTQPHNINDNLIYYVNNRIIHTNNYNLILRHIQGELKC